MSINSHRSISTLLATGALSAAFVVVTAAGQGIAAAASPAPSLQPASVSDAATSATAKVAERVRVSASLDAARVEIGRTFHLHLKVSPGRAGQRVQWQVLTSSGWAKGGTVTLRTGGVADVALHGTRAGNVTLRGFAPASRGHRAGSSAALHVTITAAAAQPTPPGPPPNAGPPPAPAGKNFP